jgi:hypothetical protein
LPVPEREFGDKPCRMVGDAGEHVGDIVRRVIPLTLTLSINE